MNIHITAKKGEIAENILLMGDPRRAQHIVDNYFENVNCYSQVRGMLGFTGEHQGMRISVQSHGMGMPSMSIYAKELICDYGVKQLIRLGTTGALQKSIQLEDIIIAMSACTDSNINNRIFGNINFAPTANFELLKKAEEVAREKNIRHHVGAVLTTDSFYNYDSQEHDSLLKHGVLGIEMETAALYTLAMQHQVQALTILNVSDHVLSGKYISADQREHSFDAMLQIALATFTGTE